MIHVENISKAFKGAPALHPLTIEFERARTSVLIGPSGCGKSTLLKLILGLTQADGGQIRFDGTVVGPDTQIEVRRRTGYVIQEGGLFPHLTARGNVSLLARSLGWEERRIDTRLDEVSETARLPKTKLDSFPSELSGGEQQRVSLMRALMLDPDVLLLDEPLGALDPLIRTILQTDLKAIFGELGKTVVMVTHDLAEAAFFADTMVLMRDGQVVQSGSFEDLGRHPAESFVTGFFSAQTERIAPLVSQLDSPGDGGTG